MKKETEKILDPAYSSYHGKVHIPYITTKPTFFSNEKILMNTACAGHVVPGVPTPAASTPPEADQQ